MRWLLLVFLGLSLTAAEGKGETPLPSPPFVRQWTHESGDGTCILGAWNNALCYRSREGLGALDLGSGRLLWRVRAGVQVAGAVLHRNRIYAVAPVEKGAELLEVEAAFGRERVLARLPVPGRYVEVGGGWVFVLDNAGTVHAWDIATGKPHWSRTLVRRSPNRTLFAEMVWTPGGLYVAIENGKRFGPERDAGGQFGLDPARGRVLWQDKAGSEIGPPPLALGDDLLLRSNGLVRRQIGTGKVLWRQQLVPNEIALVGGVLVADDGHRVTGLDPASGRRLWRLPLPSESLLVNLEGTPRALSDGRQAWLQMRRPLAGVTGQGKL